MNRKWFLLFVGIALPFWLLGQSQCSVDLPKPPFDVTGSYAGTWQGQSEDDQAQEVAACPLQITLTQDVTAGYPADHGVQGTVVIDYSCFQWPEWFPPVPPSTVNVSGLLGDNGHLVLLSGGCGTGFCVVLSLDGPAVDNDSDGHADVYSGTWHLAFLLAGVQPFGFSGTFTTNRAAN